MTLEVWCRHTEMPEEETMAKIQESVCCRKQSKCFITLMCDGTIRCLCFFVTVEWRDDWDDDAFPGKMFFLLQVDDKITVERVFMCSVWWLSPQWWYIYIKNLFVWQNHPRKQQVDLWVRIILSHILFPRLCWSFTRGFHSKMLFCCVTSESKYLHDS